MPACVAVAAGCGPGPTRVGVAVGCGWLPTCVAVVFVCGSCRRVWWSQLDIIGTREYGGGS